MMTRNRRREIIFLVLWLCALLIRPVTVVPPLSAQESESDPVRDLMLRMPPEMKIGQLVMISFPGTDVSENSEIAQLIDEYSIGGVLFTTENGNFSPSPISVVDLISTTTLLQNTALTSTRAVTELADVESELLPFSTPFLPLLIAVRPDPDGLYPTTFVSDGRNLATPLAIGASWNKQLSQSLGEVLGYDLARYGFNLYLGPDLDVLYTPNPGDPADLGTKVFGADPFWVGEMGRSFIEGLHIGSNGMVQVAPRHLPGLGSADRSLDEEVPTVQKPLEQLKQIELAPFFTAADGAPSDRSTADAFLVTHIKYRGFQGNIRQTTRPISLDAHALKSVYTLEEMTPWHTEGGLLIADNLGLPAVHLSYDPRGLTFNGRRVAQDALVAGNDLIILDMFAANDNWAVHFANVRDTLEYLVSRYNDDAVFRATVDTAVYRVLSMKLRLEPFYTIQIGNTVVPHEPTPSQLVSSRQINSQIALESLTRVFPLSDDLLPGSPIETDRIVIFTQEKNAQETPDSESIPMLVKNEISESILRFYGPEGTGVVRFNTVRSFTFAELAEALDQLEEGEPPIEEPVAEGDEESPQRTVDIVMGAVRDASWVVFAPSGLTNEPESLALKRFLATQANVINAHLAVFSFGPPYELDSTEVSKLELYYALYSTGSAFVDVAARALFRDLVAPGASPVDIPAVNYFVPMQTMPDPTQVISLYLVDEAGEELTPTTRSNIHIGDILNLRTDVIVDRNGHVVPNKTPVQFYLSFPQESIEQTIVAESLDGVAVASVALDRVGQLHITVKSEPAVSSLRLELTIRDDGVTITEVEPSPTPTSTPKPTLAPTSTPTPTPTAVPPAVHQLPDKVALPSFRRTRLLLWGVGGVLGVGVLAFLWYRERSVKPEVALRLVMWGVILGDIAYLGAVIITRWVLPAVSYALIDREYVYGAVSAIGSLTVFFLRNTITKNK